MQTGIVAGSPVQVGEPVSMPALLPTTPEAGFLGWGVPPSALMLVWVASGGAVDLAGGWVRL